MSLVLKPFFHPVQLETPLHSSVFILRRDQQLQWLQEVVLNHYPFSENLHLVLTIKCNHRNLLKCMDVNNNSNMAQTCLIDETRFEATALQDRLHHRHHLRHHLYHHQWQHRPAIQLFTTSTSRQISTITKKVIISHHLPQKGHPRIRLHLPGNRHIPHYYLLLHLRLDHLLPSLI